MLFFNIHFKKNNSCGYFFICKNQQRFYIYAVPTNFNQKLSKGGNKWENTIQHRINSI